MSRKFCMHCLRSINILAGRCPYCRSEEQGVLGRILVYLAILGTLVYFAYNLT